MCLVLSFYWNVSAAFARIFLVWGWAFFGFFANTFREKLISLGPGLFCSCILIAIQCSLLCFGIQIVSLLLRTGLTCRWGHSRQFRNHFARTHLLALCKGSSAPTCSVGKVGCAAVGGEWLWSALAFACGSALQLWQQSIFLDPPSPGGGAGVLPCSCEMALGASGSSLVSKWNSDRAGAAVESYPSSIPPPRWAVLHSGTCTSSALG